MKTTIVTLFLFCFLQNAFSYENNENLSTNQSPDGIITYDVSTDPESDSSSLLTILRKLPVVQISPLSGITLFGSNNFIISIDGRIQTLHIMSLNAYLNGFSASMVERIEISPIANTVSGAINEGPILNIVTKKQKEDNAPWVQVGASASTQELFGGNLGISIQQNKFFLNANYDYNYRGEADMKYITEIDNESFESPKYKFDHMNSHRAFVNMGWNITNNDQIVVSANLHQGRETTEIESTNEIIPEVSKEKYIDKTKSKPLYLQTSVIYQHTWDNGAKASVQYEYGENPLTSSSKQIISSEYNSESEIMYLIASKNKYKLHNHVAKLDFSFPFTQHQHIDLGVRYINYNGKYNSSNTVEESITFPPASGILVPPTASVHYDKTTDIWNGYLQYNLNISSFNLHAGLHIGKPVRTLLIKDDFKVNPYLSLGYNWGNSSINAGYSIQSSSPSMIPLSVQIQEMNKLYLNYQLKESTFNIQANLIYMCCNNGLGYYYVGIPAATGLNDVMVLRTDNIHSKQTILSTMFSYIGSDKFSYNIAGSVSYSDYDRKDSFMFPQSLHGFSGSISGGFDWYFPYECDLGINGGYYFPGIAPTRKDFNNYFYRIHLSKSFANNRFRAAIYANDFLENKKTVKMKEDEYTQKLVVPGREIGIKLIYSFN